MATIYIDSFGNIISFASSFFENQEFSSNPPAGTSFTIDFDESTNTALVADIKINPKLYAAPGGVLQKSGVNSTINANSSLYAIFAAVISGVPKTTLESFLISLWNGTATTAQTQKAIAYIGVLLHAKLGLI